MAADNEKRPGAESPGARESGNARGDAGAHINSSPQGGQSLIALHRGTGLDAAKMVFVTTETSDADALHNVGLHAVAPSSLDAIEHTDWRALAGKNVTLVPRSTKPSILASIRSGDALLALTPKPHVQAMRIPNSPPDGGVAEWIEQARARGLVGSKAGTAFGDLLDLHVNSFEDFAAPFRDAVPPPPKPDDIPQHDAHLRQFFDAVLGPDDGGVIELRMLFDPKTEGPRRPPLAIRFYKTIDELIAVLPDAMAAAEEKNGGLFFGAKRRKNAGSGTAADVVAGSAAWADVDSKLFPGGEAEAYQRLNAFPLRPSIFVVTPGGFHLYWLMKEDCEPAENELINKGIAKAIGADHAFDLPRVLRIPYTFHRKDPESPKLVTIKELNAERRYNASELLDAIRLLGIDPAKPKEKADTESTTEVNLPANILSMGMTKAASDLVYNDKKILPLFLGTGKEKVGNDGKARDTSESGYDFSLVFALIRKGLTNPVDLATAMVNRPDGHARGKGREYVARTIRVALEKLSSASATAIGIKPESVDIFDSEPPTYRFVIRGKEIRMSSGDIGSKKRFCQRVLEALHFLPEIPTSKDAPWSAFLNGWLKNAVHKEMPPEASSEGALREVVEDAINAFTPGDDISDLERATSVRLPDGRVAFHVSAVEKAIAEEHPKVDRPRLCRVLHELGYESKTRRVGEKNRRLWAKRDAS